MTGISVRKEIVVQASQARAFAVFTDGIDRSPKRVVLTWQITAQWQYDPSFETEVEVNFVALGPNQTRVTLEHHNLERFGPATEEIRAMFDSPDGWNNTLAAFANVADAKGGAPALRCRPSVWLSASRPTMERGCHGHRDEGDVPRAGANAVVLGFLLSQGIVGSVPLF